MNTKEELTKCPDCQVNPGERHVDFCDVTRCKYTGVQMLMCYVDSDELEECDEEPDHTCAPTVWTGEWPGVKVCRDNGWYTAPDSIWGEMEDLNCVMFRAVWNPELEDFEARK